MTRFAAWMCLIGISLFLVACPAEQQNHADNDPEGHHEHADNDAGHDHAGHDHDGHDHGHSHSNITLTPLAGSPAYADASLTTSGIPSETADGKYQFDFAVNNYTLGQQTEPASPNNLANSGKGQHIHFIVNNGPYSAHYEPSFTTDKLSEPGNYVVLAFLSRSYHESVKNANSFAVIQVNNQNSDQASVDLDAAHMFYSRPKGTYKGADTEKVLLDFFLLNNDLAADGNKVRVTINDEFEQTLDTWQPYVIEGAPLGELKVKLELLDASGQLVPSPYNPVERKVTLAPADTE